MKNIIITGGAGFIGSHLCEGLVNNGHVIYCIDNLSSGNLENLAHLLRKNNFKFMNCDITATIPKINEEIDEIYHLASLASPKDYNERPLETALANTTGTLNMLKFAKEKRARILFTSTSEIYGNPEQHPQTEEYTGALSPLSERACYAESKRFGETLASIFKKKYKIDVKIVRIFNTYGPKMRYFDGRVIPTFIWRGLRNEDIPVYGNGAQTRSFCYISDMIDGIIKMMDSNYFGPINLGNPNEEISILALANKIIEMIGSKSKLIFLPNVSDDPSKRKPDISKAQKFLSWQLEYDLDSGLEQTVKYYQQRIRGHNTRKNNVKMLHI